jgi:tetratricopeptide (TPR) repeat protein
LPTLIFLLDEKVKWPERYREGGVGGKRIRIFRGELQNSKWMRSFSNPDHLSTEVLASVSVLDAQIRTEAFQNARKPMRHKSVRIKRTPKKGKILKKIPIPVPEKLDRHFTDRSDELSKLQQCFADKNLKMVLICGREGIGKTTLVTKLVHNLMVGFRDKLLSNVKNYQGIVFISLNETVYRSMDRIMEIISQSMNEETAAELASIWKQPETSLRDRLAIIFKGLLTKHRCLIILDNLESILDDENQILDEYSAIRQFIDAFLEYDHSSMLIVTSRRALSFSSEIELASIGRLTRISLDNGLPSDYAISLLRKLDPDGRFGIRDASEIILEDIACRCQYIPRTLVTLVSTIRNQETWNLDTLKTNESLLSEIIEYPARVLYASLPSENERFVMQALAVFNKPVPSEAVKSILPGLPIDQILSELFKNYVVNHDHGQFWLHPLDQQYAYNQIFDQGSKYSKPVMHSLAADYYQSLPCPPKDKRSSLEDVGPILDAIEHLLLAGRIEDAVALFIDSGLHEDLYWWGYCLLLKDFCRKFLHLDVPSKWKIVLHTQLGKVQRNMGNLEESRKTYENALSLLDSSIERKYEIALYIALGDIYFYLNDINRSLIYHREAERLLSTNPNPTLQSENTGDMANIMWLKGEYKQAQEMYKLAIDYSRKAKNKIHEGIWNGGLGNIYASLIGSNGNTTDRDKAVSYYLKAIEIAKESNDRRHESHWNGILGSFYLKIGEYELAEKHLKVALSISYKINYGRMLSTQVQLLTTLYDERIRRLSNMRDFAKALKIVNDFVRVADEIGLSSLIIEANRQYVEVKINEMQFLLQSDKIDEAIIIGREILEHSTEKFHISKNKVYEYVGGICANWGRLRRHEKILQLSVDAYSKAIIAGSDDPQPRLYEERGSAYAIMGKIDDAMNDYRTCLKIDPQMSGAALSLAEVNIWAGHYQEARALLDSLQDRLNKPADKMISAWLMCHTLNLAGQDYSFYQKFIEDNIKETIDINYNVKDIEYYLRRLDKEKFSNTQIQNCWLIQDLINKFIKDT